mmetsp:Transcript_13934/g.37433  ORF Transcript_13934/g.37433 Transcript_13934/m.37433 type:complete len:204 (+) Transcript_13934:2204-2815(+)
MELGSAGAEGATAEEAPLSRRSRFQSAADEALKNETELTTCCVVATSWLFELRRPGAESAGVLAAAGADASVPGAPVGTGMMGGRDERWPRVGTRICCIAERRKASESVAPAGCGTGASVSVARGRPSGAEKGDDCTVVYWRHSCTTTMGEPVASSCASKTALPPVSPGLSCMLVPPGDCGACGLMCSCGTRTSVSVSTVDDL